MAKGHTDIGIRNLKPGSARREIPDGNGLYIVVHPSGTKSYAVRYRYGGKPRKLTLKGITLKAARKEAADALYEVEKGRDPSAAKRQKKEAQQLAAENTFKAVAEEYLKREGGMKRDDEGRPKFAAGKLRTANQQCATLERLVYKTLGDRPIAEIKRSEIIRLLDKIDAGELVDDDNPIEGGPVMADRTLAVIRRILNWHAVRDENYRSPIVRGMARVKPKERARTRTLTDDELRAIWKAASEGEGSFLALIKFLLLTAARRNEAAGMKREEVNGTDWTLPASRNKTKLDLVRPLSEKAQAVLETQPEIDGCPYVFTTGSRALSGFSKFKADFDEACGATGWMLHDLRRTARSLMSRAGVNADHAERCLGHVIGGVRGTSDRHEYHAEKKQAFDALAVQIERIINPPKGNVTALPSSRKRA
jgi:integrase